MTPTFVVLLLAYTLSQFYRSFLAVIAADLARDLRLDAADLGAISATWFAAFAVAQFPVGQALDRVGPARTLAAFTLSSVAGAALLAVSGSFWAAVLAMALIGIGCAPALMACVHLFASTETSGRVALLSSTIIGLGTVGNLLGASPLAYLAGAIGWRAALGGMAGVTATVVLLVVLVIPNVPRPREPAGVRSSIGGLGTILRLRALWPILPIVSVSYAVVIATRALWIAPFLGSVHGFDAAERGDAAFLMGAAMALGALGFGPLAQAVGSVKRTTVLGVLATAAGFAGLGIWGGSSAGVAVALLAAVGAAGTTYAILLAHARDFIPPSHTGRGVTAVNFVFIGGAGLVQWLSGRYIDAALDGGLQPAVVYGRLFLAFAALLLAATLVYLFAPATGASGRTGATSTSGPR